MTMQIKYPWHDVIGFRSLMLSSSLMEIWSLRYFLVIRFIMLFWYPESFLNGFVVQLTQSRPHNSTGITMHFVCFSSSWLILSLHWTLILDFLNFFLCIVDFASLSERGLLCIRYIFVVSFVYLLFALPFRMYASWRKVRMLRSVSNAIHFSLNYTSFACLHLFLMIFFNILSIIVSLHLLSLFH